MPESRKRKKKGKKVTGKGRTSLLGEVIKQITPPPVIAVEVPSESSQDIPVEIGLQEVPPMPAYEVAVSRFFQGNCVRCEKPLDHEFGEEEYTCEDCDATWTVESVLALKLQEPAENQEDVVVVGETNVIHEERKPSLIARAKQLLWS